MDDASLRRAIAHRVEVSLQRCRELCDRHRVPLPTPSVHFDLRGRAAGQCRIDGKHAALRFNLAIARRHTDDFLQTTVAHEVAHLVTATCHGHVRPHGAEWRATMHHLGITDPSRCHEYDLHGIDVASQRRWPYVCDCMEHAVSTTLHNRMLRGATVYNCRRCGGRLRPAPGDDG